MKLKYNIKGKDVEYEPDYAEYKHVLAHFLHKDIKDCCGVRDEETLEKIVKYILDYDIEEQLEERFEEDLTSYFEEDARNQYED